MLAKLLGLGDLFAVVTFIFAPLFPIGFPLLGAKYLLFKGGIFAFIARDIASFLDVLCSILMLLYLWDIFQHSAVTIGIIIYLIQKAALSLAF